MRRSCLMIGLMWLLIDPATIRAADAPPLVLDHLTPSEGMPQGTVYATLQDSQGFVWLATEDGLVRYDGHELVRYAYSRNAEQGLPGNFIRQIVEDANHDLWIAIKDGGLARWNRSRDTFKRYRHDPSTPGSLGSDVARTVVIDARGRIWVGTNDAGIDILDPTSGRIEHLRHDKRNSDSLSDDQIFALAVDRSGSVWVGTAAGLDRWQPERNAFAHLLSGKQVSSIVESQDGNFWAGTFDGGLERMEASGRLITSFSHDAEQPSSLASDDVHALLEDRAGHMWIGTSEGLDLLDRAAGTFAHYRRDDRDSGSLRDSSIMSLYQDAAGLVWIGTRTGGVSRWNPRSWELGGRRPEWLDGKPVTSFADAPNGKVWIASMGGGLVQFDESTGDALGIDAIVGRHDALGDQRVMALRLDRHDTLWIGTMSSGLKKLTPRGRLESVPVKPGDPHGLSAAGIQTIFEARDGKIWLGVHDGGANVIDTGTGLIRQLPYGTASPSAISASSVTAFAEDAQGNIWMGTDDGGLDLANAEGSVVKVFRHDPADPSSLPSNTIYALEIDGDGQVWIATDGGGLARVVGSAASPNSIRFKVVSREEGLSSDTIYGLLSDPKGRIWLSGNAGLMRFDPGSQSVKTYHREHGLQGEEFDYNAYHRLRDGRLCFGGPGGFNIFDPSRLTETAQAPRVALTSLEVLGVPILSKTPYWLLNRIVLDYQASIVSLDFGALDFVSPKRNRLAYRVAGLSDRWIDLGTQHRVTLTNLDPGDHLLEVRAANADSVWSDPPLRLTVHRNPAPWRSPWAYAGYALVLLLLVVQRVRTHRAKIQGIVRAKQRLESEVALRTPMNGVVGMTELLGRTPLSTTQARLTQTIRSSAQILLQIVNDLLDLSKIQAGKVEFESLPLDLVRLLEECTTIFAGAAEAKDVELIVCPPPEISGLLGDPLRIRQIVLNLVGNAVKFTLQGEVVVKADIVMQESGGAVLDIAVSDTGVGMDAATIERIFEPFTQADESTTRRFGGTGLGLAICRELAQLLHGTVSAESRPNVGSTFHLRLPLRLAAQPAVAASGPAQFTPRTVRILTRRPALAESLVRHVTAIGLTAICDQDDRLEPDAGTDLYIVDLSTHAAVAESAFRDAGSGSPRIALVATPAQLDKLACRSSIDPDLVIGKPVHRDELLSALRAAAGEALSPGAADRAAQDGSLIGGHVLLVEDEPVNAAVAQGYLAELGCTSVWVNSGLEAIARSATERFDLVMMDLNMPGMDGFATTRLIREREGASCGAPIIALTAHDAKNYLEPCLSAGMNDLMSKPYTLEQCEKLLRHWIKNVDAAPRKRSSPRIQAAAEIDATTVMGLRSLRGGGPSDLYSKLVDLFQPASGQAVADLGSLLAADDFAAAAGVCHKLASSAANVGALAFSRYVRQLEKTCNGRDAARAAQLYETIRAAHPALIEELVRLQLAESA